jgi:hypothetical protein
LLLRSERPEPVPAFETGKSLGPRLRGDERRDAGLHRLPPPRSGGRGTVGRPRRTPGEEPMVEGASLSRDDSKPRTTRRPVTVATRAQPGSRPLHHPLFGGWSPSRRCAGEVKRAASAARASALVLDQPPQAGRWAGVDLRGSEASLARRRKARYVSRPSTSCPSAALTHRTSPACKHRFLT